MMQSKQKPPSLGFIRRFIILAAGALMFTLGAIATNALALLFLPFRGRPAVRRQARKVLRVLFRFWITFVGATGVARFELAGTAGLSQVKGTLFIANHPTLMDALYLLALVPDAVCIFKKSLQRNLLLGPMARLSGFIANDSGPDLVREAGRALSEGCNLIIFPEGTRSRGRLKPFKSGFALIATRYRAPVQTLLLGCEPPLLPGGVGLRGVPLVAPVVTIRPGRIFLPGSDPHTLSFMEEIEMYYRKSLPLKSPSH